MLEEKILLGLNNIEVSDTNSSDEQQLGPSLGNLNNNKRIILVDDEENILFT